MAGAEIEIVGLGPSDSASAGGDPADLGGRLDLLDRQPELRRDVDRRLSRQSLPRLPPLGERRERHLDEERRSLAERLRLAASARKQHRSFTARLDPVQEASPIGRTQIP